MAEKAINGVDRFLHFASVMNENARADMKRAVGNGTERGTENDGGSKPSCYARQPPYNVTGEANMANGTENGTESGGGTGEANAANGTENGTERGTKSGGSKPPPYDITGYANAENNGGSKPPPYNVTGEANAEIGETGEANAANGTENGTELGRGAYSEISRGLRRVFDGVDAVYESKFRGGKI